VKRVPTYYSPAYAPASVPLLHRLAVSAQALRAADLVEMREPPPLDRAQLRGLHAEAYLEAFDGGLEPLASSQGIRWAPWVRDAAYAMLAGQLAAVEAAERTGLAMNLARGFHHAVFERGSGYCALNGLAFVALRFPRKKVFVIDCDEHGGNGTEEYALRLPNLFNASMFGTRFGCLGHERSWPFEVRLSRDGPTAHLRALAQIEALLDACAPDLILYQAGADSHEADPKSLSGFSAEALAERDRQVFRMARRRGIPLVFVVAGGYQAAEAIARINASTVRAAISVFAT
jgi:acetoin utilization deacetylase AcuC-like enzyme